MTTEEFRALGQKEQEQVIYEEGVYIGKRKDNGYTIVLYQVAAFYVEVFYKVYRKKIEKFEVSTDPDIISLYPEDNANFKDLFSQFIL